MTCCFHPGLPSFKVPPALLGAPSSLGPGKFGVVFLTEGWGLCALPGGGGVGVSDVWLGGKGLGTAQAPKPCEADPSDDPGAQSQLGAVRVTAGWGMLQYRGAGSLCTSWDSPRLPAVSQHFASSFHPDSSTDPTC